MKSLACARLDQTIDDSISMKHLQQSSRCQELILCWSSISASKIASRPIVALAGKQQQGRTMQHLLRRSERRSPGRILDFATLQSGVRTQQAVQKDIHGTVVGSRADPLSERTLAFSICSENSCS